MRAPATSPPPTPAGARRAPRAPRAAVALGAAALLAGCPTVDLGDPPVDIGQCRPAGGLPYFQAEIWPTLLAPADPARTCARAGCHLDGSGRSALQLRVTPAVDYDFDYRVTLQYLNCGTPEASPLLTKPLRGVDGHGGGDLIPGLDDPAAVAFLGWFR